MVKRLLMLAALVGVGVASWALPFQLEMPKHDNPVDPYNPENLDRLYVQATAVAQYTPIPIATATPTATFCAGCTPTNTPTICIPCTPTVTPSPTPTSCGGCNLTVLQTWPNNGATVEVPYNFGSNYYYYYTDAGQVVVTFYFNQDIDPYTMNSYMSVTVSPKVNFSVYAFSGRMMSVSFNTVDGNSGNMIPMKLNTTYAVTLGGGLKSVSGQPVSPYTLTFTTGGFKMFSVGYDNNYNYGSEPGVFVPAYFSAFFNAPVQFSAGMVSNFSLSPAPLISAGAYNYSSYANSVWFQTCSAPASTAFTFSYLGGVNSTQGGASAPARLGLTLTSRPFEISSSSFSGGSGYTSGSLYFTSPLDLTTTAARITISPPINAGTVVVSNSGCGSSSYSNSAGMVNFSYGCLTYSPYTCGSPFLTGTAYTIIVPVTVQNLSGQNLSKAYTYFNNPL